MKTQVQKIKKSSVGQISANECRLLPIVNILFSSDFDFEVDSNGVYISKRGVLITYLTLVELEFLSTYADVDSRVDDLICQVAKANDIHLIFDTVVLP